MSETQYIHVDIAVPEHQMPESDMPWFEVTAHGHVWRGQATIPPVPQEDGSLLYSFDARRVAEEEV